jgi:cellulose synthase/poly-beta-1,6-N-acetylglucosamine synthase-like glycosyltransferase
MNPADALILSVYYLTLGVLAIYSVHRLYLVRLRRKFGAEATRGVARTPENWPAVTVQLPLYNEPNVAARLIDAVAAIDYQGPLEIQVLDDSTDATVDIVAERVEALRARGVRIEHVRRTSRDGFKAGALAHGMRISENRFFAVFDADFVPPPHFLTSTIPYFGEERVGMVQARWGHLNRERSLLTRVQAIYLDSHFAVESAARHLGHRFFNFNGTAGVWRRQTIDAAGGWQHDTLTEDLDLSYRAQLLGWKFVFLPELVSPAEVPVEMNSFKSQQHRWAKGSIQTCMKLLPRILRSNQPLHVKAEAFFHLTANFNYLLMTVLSVLMFPAMYVRYNMGWTEMLLIDIPLFLAATMSFFNFYMVSQRELYPDWRARLKYLPFLMSIGIGLCINNSRAVLEALFKNESEFARTPKYGIERASDEWAGKKYHQTVGVQSLIELALGLYFTGTVFYALINQIYGTLPFLMLFQVGFLYTGLLSILQQFTGDEEMAPEIAK